MKQHTLTTEQQGTWTFQAELLGAATSEGEWHDHESEYVLPGKDPVTGRKNRCSACRWHEAAIYRTHDGLYVLHTVGRTTLPGEIPFARMVKIASAFELLELAVVRAEKPYIPATTARALAQAADKDEHVREAYVNRAVV